LAASLLVALLRGESLSRFAKRCEILKRLVF